MEAAVPGLLHQDARQQAFARLSRFRGDFYDSLTARGDALFELADALLCTDGPVKTLVDLSLAPEHRRGHGSPYAALNNGAVDGTGCDGGWPSCRGRPTAA